MDQVKEIAFSYYTYQQAIINFMSIMISIWQTNTSNIIIWKC